MTTSTLKWLAVALCVAALPLWYGLAYVPYVRTVVFLRFVRQVWRNAGAVVSVKSSGKEAGRHT